MPVHRVLERDCIVTPSNRLTMYLDLYRCTVYIYTPVHCSLLTAHYVCYLSCSSVLLWPLLHKPCLTVHAPETLTMPGFSGHHRAGSGSSQTNNYTFARVCFASVGRKSWRPQDGRQDVAASELRKAAFCRTMSRHGVT